MTFSACVLRRQKTFRNTRSHLKNRILAQGQGGTEFQPADILKYFEDLKRGPNTEIGTKDFFEMASKISYLFHIRHRITSNQRQMTEDIRNKTNITHEDILSLNFIRKPGAYVFRKYHKQGLRSHIMEVLSPEDVLKQHKGEMVNGIRMFPWADPIKILRIFRTKFSCIADVFDEVKTIKIIEKYLPKDSYAKSDEFIADYILNETKDFILCGLQEYIEGEVLNPWDPIPEDQLADFLAQTNVKKPDEHWAAPEQRIQKFYKKVEHFIACIKRMILEAHYVPDFAGVENLLITPAGDIKLVDINNISKVYFTTDIRLDDKGYPVCDKSIEAVSMLEKELLGKPIDYTEKLYRIFLDPQRMKDVGALEDKFHLSAISKLVYR
jgi:hypothetical protein